jgi:hypothetical protein
VLVVLLRLWPALEVGARVRIRAGLLWVSVDSVVDLSLSIPAFLTCTLVFPALALDGGGGGRDHLLDALYDRPRFLFQNLLSKVPNSVCVTQYFL